jgi:hypothetical protein
MAPATILGYVSGKDFFELENWKKTTLADF